MAGLAGLVGLVGLGCEVSQMVYTCAGSKQKRDVDPEVLLLSPKLPSAQVAKPLQSIKRTN